MTNKLQASVEDLAYALAVPGAGRVAVLTIASRVPAPVSKVVEALEALIEQGGGSVARDELDGCRAIRFRDAPPAGTAMPTVDWAALLAQIGPDDSWLGQARLDHDVLGATAALGSSVGPAEVAGATTRTLAEVLERLQAWSAKELVVEEFDDAAGKRRFRLPPVAALAGDAAKAIAPKPPNRKPLILGVGIALMVLLLVGGLVSSASGDLSALAAACKKGRSQLENVEERRSRLDTDLKPILAAPGVTSAERTRLMDELAGATNRVTVERKRYQKAQADYAAERSGWLAGLASSSDDDAACGYDP